MASKPRINKLLTICLGLVLAMGLVLGSAPRVEAKSILDLFRPKGVQNKVDTILQSDLEAAEGKVNRSEMTTGIASDNAGWVLLMTAGSGVASREFINSITPEQRQIIADKYGNGAISDVGGWIATLYTPPASTQTYLADVLHNMNIVPKAQAQGVGFASLDPILSAWKIFRNAAYLFFVIIFLIIGFMIMFRHKIKGQAVVTAQQAIPSIIISLLFVTFSYAIAGLLIDAMYLLMYLIVGLFNANTKLLDANFLEIGAKFIGSGASGAYSTVNDVIKQIVDVAVLGDVLAFASGLTVAVIMAVAVLIGVFKLFFELIKTYINIILSITFSPIILMFGAMPGKDTFSGWIKGLIGNLLVFPAVLLILIVHAIISESGVTTGGFMPPYMLGRGAANTVTAVIGVGLILVAPELIQKLKKVMGADGGIFAEFAGTGLKNLKQGVPLGGRVAGVGVGGSIGAFGGGLLGIPQAIREQRLDPILQNAWSGFDQGAKTGVSAAFHAGKSMGANQPDILNPLTQIIDKKYGTESMKRYERTAQLWEDTFQRVGIVPPDPSKPAKK